MDKRINYILSATDRTDTGISSARRNMNSLESAAVGLRAGLAAAAVAAGAVLARAVFTTSIEFQRLNASLLTVTGSQQAANQEFNRLTAFAAETPYQLQEVVAAYIKLKALGLDPSTEALRSYGNTASAMGKSLNQVIEAVADAATGEFERLKEFGIKAKSQGDQVTFTFRGVSTTVRKEAGAIEDYLRRIGDVEFASGMENQMKTLGGAVSNLGDAWDQFLVSLGDTGPVSLATEAITGLAGSLTNFSNSLKLLKAYQDDKISFWEFFSADPEQAAVLIERASLIDTELARLQGRLRTMENKKKGNFWWSSADETALQNTREAIRLRQQQLDMERDLRIAAADSAPVDPNAGLSGDPTPPKVPVLPKISSDEWNRILDQEAIDEAAAAVSNFQAQLQVKLQESPPLSLGFDNFDISQSVADQQADQAREEAATAAQEAADIAAAERFSRLQMSYASENELVQSAYADRMAILNQAQQAGLLSEEEYAETKRRITQQREDEITRIDQAAQNLRLQTASNTTSALMNLTNALYNFGDQKSRKMFELNKVAGIANATVNTYAGAAKALEQGGFYGIALAAAVIAAGLANIASISATTFDGGDTPSGGYGGGTPSSPIVTQPLGNQQTIQQDLTIRIHGVVDDAFIEDTLIPRINDAGTRNVRIEYDD